MNAKQIKSEEDILDEAQEGITTNTFDKTCGIIMPIADMENYEVGHWLRVKELIKQAASNSGFRARLVSESEDIGVIHSRIVQNIHDDEIIVCDVSGKNANVMFELGLRLAFDKPVIIIIDERTGYSFDTSPIEHLGYRSDMRYHDTIDFIDALAKKIVATVAKKVDDPNYSPFVGHFGKFTVAKLREVEGTPVEYFGHRLDEIQNTVDQLVTHLKQDRGGGIGIKTDTDIKQADDRFYAGEMGKHLDKFMTQHTFTNFDDAFNFAISELPKHGFNMKSAVRREAVKRHLRHFFLAHN